MKHLVGIAMAATMLLPLTAQAQEYTNGYYRSNGTYVQGYYHTAPDGNPYNNYSSRGNTNPYNGQNGTAIPYSTNIDNNVGLPSTNLQSPYISGFRH